MTINFAEMSAMDDADPLSRFREQFVLPSDTIYLDGNSLGALPLRTTELLNSVVKEQWGHGLIRSWNDHDWIGAPARVGAKIAGLIGAGPDEVIVADSTSINIFKLLAAAIQRRPERSVILTEPGNFPTDLYVAQGVKQAFGDVQLRTAPVASIAEHLSQETGVLLLTHAHYKSGAVHDMAALTVRAHDVGAMVLWDLSHSAGALAVDLNGANADLAVGCGYKYLNGGPGAPAFLYVAKRHQNDLRSPLSGWMGHAAPFEFKDEYDPAPGIARFLCGTPSILGLLALEAGVDLLLEADIGRIVRKSRKMSDLFISLVDQRCSGLGLDLASPSDATRRGSHISFAHPNAYAVCQVLIERGVIGDFRSPNLLRFGFAPLYLSYKEIWHAVVILENVLASDAWQEDRYQQRAKVT